MFPVQFITLLLLQCALGGISKLCHTELSQSFMESLIEKLSSPRAPVCGAGAAETRSKSYLVIPKRWVKAEDDEFVGGCAEIPPERWDKTFLEGIYPTWCHLILQNPSEHSRNRVWALLLGWVPKAFFLPQHHHSHLPQIQHVPAVPNPAAPLFQNLMEEGEEFAEFIHEFCLPKKMPPGLPAKINQGYLLKYTWSRICSAGWRNTWIHGF